jgi:hypothetical protein
MSKLGEIAPMSSYFLAVPIAPIALAAHRSLLLASEVPVSAEVFCVEPRFPLSPNLRIFGVEEGSNGFSNVRVPLDVLPREAVQLKGRVAEHGGAKAFDAVSHEVDQLLYAYVS